MKRYMEDLKEMLCEELEQIVKGGELTSSTLDAVQKLTHSLKSVETIMAMEDYSGDESGRSYDGSYEGGSGRSYRRGRSSVTGRYISRASGRYSRDYSGHDGLKEKLEELMEDAPDDQSRQELQRLINKM